MTEREGGIAKDRDREAGRVIERERGGGLKGIQGIQYCLDNSRKWTEVSSMPTNRAGLSCGLAKTAHAGPEIVAVGGLTQGTLANICLPFVGCVKIPSKTHLVDVVEIFNVGRREWRKGG